MNVERVFVCPSCGRDYNDYAQADGCCQVRVQYKCPVCEDTYTVEGDADHCFAQCQI